MDCSTFSDKQYKETYEMESEKEKKKKKNGKMTQHKRNTIFSFPEKRKRK